MNLITLDFTENLLFDIMDNKEAVIKARDKFLKIWPQYHKSHWDVFRKHFPGDCSWLMWAPGRTYACQCDFSTVLSPKLFEELVIPELEALGKYLEYIVWHLDGPDEIKHLDFLLELPQVKAIQWCQGSGKPSPAHWLPMLKIIRSHKKSLILRPESREEIKTLLEELSPEGLFFDVKFDVKTTEEAQALIKTVEDFSK